MTDYREIHCDLSQIFNHVRLDERRFVFLADQSLPYLSEFNKNIYSNKRPNADSSIGEAV